MKLIKLWIALITITAFTFTATAQDKPVHPTVISTGVFYGLTPPLKNLPVLSDKEFKEMEKNADVERNEGLEHRSYPYAKTALPKGPDPVWQRQMGSSRSTSEILMNFNGQPSPYFPPDANGTVGPDHYMQTINTVYAIYNKTTGALEAGPTNMNQLFSGVIGSNCNDGDPVVLFDEQADRWLAIEFSLCTSNDRMMIAVSTTNDPTGTWYKYSFDVADMPDYPKFGIWRDGYYMGDNNGQGNDIYVFQRDSMLVGGTAQMVGFNNPWRPSTIDGFMCVPPVDDDGAFAPEGSPGMFITINDDAIGGGSDQLWVYELAVDWATPGNSTFDRTQQIDVPPFDSNFGNTWSNIPQPGTNQKLDAIPMVIMNRPQYRNFGSYETLVCCHTVDVDNTNHAGIRWYELRKDLGQWVIRQSGTYAPDENNRWMGSIALNANDEIGLAYSISSTSVYPGLRFTGQSSSEYAAASGILDEPEEVITDGTSSQNGANRWGDYSNLSVDPVNNSTFWFTSEYSGNRSTRIASFVFGPPPLQAGFMASDTSFCPGDSTTFTDESLGTPVSWTWNFPGGEPPTSTLQNPVVSYSSPGYYNVELIVSDFGDADTLTQTNYIHIFSSPAQPLMPSGPDNICSTDSSAEYMTDTVPDATSYIWNIVPSDAGTIQGDWTIATFYPDTSFTGQVEISVRAMNDCDSSDYSEARQMMVNQPPEAFNLSGGGGFCAGGTGLEISLDSSSVDAVYELFLNDTTTGQLVQGTGSAISFGLQTQPGNYTVFAHGTYCNAMMTGVAEIYLIYGPPAAPATPEGALIVCSNDMGTLYTTSGADTATSYIWTIDPPEAGTISGTNMEASVDWNPIFGGSALISVAGINDCGTGASSNALEVAVNAAPLPTLSGDTSVCAGGEAEIYSSPDIPGDTYDWQVNGGTISDGAGTSQITVDWVTIGPGSVSLTEGASNGCSASQLYPVIIHDCTGIPEISGNKVSLYPNPVEGNLTIQINTIEKGSTLLKIFNYTGQEVYSKVINVQDGKINTTLSTSDLPSGSYAVKIISSRGKLYDGKFLKVK